MLKIRESPEAHDIFGDVGNCGLTLAPAAVMFPTNFVGLQALRKARRKGRKLRVSRALAALNSGSG